MTDLTAITTPFGLLDTATREALKAHGGPYEAFCADRVWMSWAHDAVFPWYEHMAIRVKPPPPKPREWWLRVYGADQVVVFSSAEAADMAGGRAFPLVRVREVLD